MKKLYHIAESVTLESGGVRTVLENLNNYLNANEKFFSSILANQIEDGDPHHHFPSTKFKFWGYSSELESFLKSNIKPEDLIHLHGVFMHAQYATSRFANKSNMPYVITPHGMLEPWHLKDKQAKKRVYMALLLNSILAKAKIIHAITPFEKANLYKLTKHKNIIEIPNFIKYSDLPKIKGYNPEEEYLLFLSRLHPKKGLDILIESMTKIEDKKIKLKIVGSENGYSDALKKIVRKAGLENRIEFLGGIFGDAKFELYANAKAFVAPSYSEAIGMVNLEAAACKTPVITTFYTGISPDWNTNGGIMINPTLEELTSAINAATNWSNEERFSRGENLSNFVLNNYSWEKRGYLWNDLYSSL